MGRDADDKTEFGCGDVNQLSFLTISFCIFKIQ